MADHARIAIVTGAGSGIGSSTTDRLLLDGYRVAALDLDTTLLKDRVATGNVFAYEVDVCDAPATAAVVDDVARRHGTIDLLVNNAGIGIAADALSTSDADWQAILDVNLTAAFTLSKHVLPHMLAKGGGVIVNVASVASVVGVRNRAAYCASKAGLLGLTRSLAVDYAAKGLRVNAICPGTVATEWIEKILADAEDPVRTRAAMEARQLDGRMGAPEEVAHGIAFLASDDARFVNGSAFLMDGGMSAI